MEVYLFLFADIFISDSHIKLLPNENEVKLTVKNQAIKMLSR